MEQESFDGEGGHFKIINTPRLTRCRICDSDRLEPVIDLGYQPWCNNFLKKEEIGEELFYPLRVVFCHDCSAAQLDFTVPKEVMFGDHTYRSGITKTFNEYFKNVAQEVDARFFKDLKHKSVLDIGSNDGGQLKYYTALGYDVLGVESSKTIAKIANDEGIPTTNAFFNLDFARKLDKKFHVINAASVFYHLEELHCVTKGIKEVLRDDGVFVVQFVHMKRLIEQGGFDQIYHEHLLYYNLKTIEHLLNRHGLALFDGFVSSIHGGSIVGFVTHKGAKNKSDRLNALIKEEDDANSNDISTYNEFAKCIRDIKAENIAFLENAKKRGKRIYGLGAPVKGNTLLNYFKVGTTYLECLLERNPLRRGLYSPGMHIPVMIEDEIILPPDALYYVLAWNFKKEILERYKPLIDRGAEFFFPVNPKEV